MAPKTAVRSIAVTPPRGEFKQSKEIQTAKINKTQEDFDQEEAQEATRERYRDPVDSVVGSNFKMINAGYSEWVHPRTHRRFAVTNYYIHEKLVIDYPPTEEESEGRRQFLATIGVAYVGILPGQPVDIIKNKNNGGRPILAELIKEARVIVEKAAKS